MRHQGRLVALVAVALLALSGCVVNQSPPGGGGGATSGQAARGCRPPDPSGPLTFALVSHSAPGDSFWDVVKSGAEQAGEQMGATVTYAGDPDPDKQSLLIDNAVSQDVDGLIVSMANPGGVRSSVQAAVRKCIPVVTINSGLEESQAYGAITHVGQSEELAGEAAGRKFNELGVTKAICVIHEAGNVGLEQRCQGFAQVFQGQTQNLQVDVSNVKDAQDTMTSKLADTSVDGVLTLNPDVAKAAYNAQQASDSKAVIGTFDVSTDICRAILAGEVAFAIDQQPYVQGYLPVVMLWLDVTNGNEVGGGRPVYSGPAFVTKENAAQVMKFAARGTR